MPTLELPSVVVEFLKKPEIINLLQTFGFGK